MQRRPASNFEAGRRLFPGLPAGSGNRRGRDAAAVLVARLHAGAGVAGRMTPDRYPHRIVCLTEETTETLYLLGEGDRVLDVLLARDRDDQREPALDETLSYNILWWNPAAGWVDESLTDP